MSGALSSGILCFLLTEMLDEFINDEQCGGRSSVGRAADCDSVCRGFEPHRPPHYPSLYFSKIRLFSLNGGAHRTQALLTDI